MTTLVTAASIRLSALAAGLWRCFLALTNPHPALIADPQRQQARILAALTLLLAPAALIAHLIVMTMHTTPPTAHLILPTVPVSSTFYLVSRTRWSPWGILPYIALWFAWTTLIIQATLTPHIYAVAYILPLFIASLFYRLRAILAWLLLAFGLVVAIIGLETEMRYLLFITLTFITIPTLISAIVTEQYLDQQRRLRQQAQQMAASEARYHSLFEATPIALWEEDFSAIKAALTALRARIPGNLADYLRAHPATARRLLQQMRVLDVNAATLKMLNMPSKEALIAQLDRVIPAHDTEPVIAELMAIADGHLRYERSDHLNYDASGVPVDIWLHWRVVPGHEQDYGRVIVTVQDLTQRKQWEARRLALQLDQDRMYLLSRFIGEAAHDLNSSLTILKTMTYLLRRQNVLEQAERLTVMETHITRLHTMIEDMLTVARLDQAQHDLNVRWMQLGTLLEQLCADFQPMAEARQQTLRAAIEPNMPLLKGDGALLKQAFTHVIDNALRHTPAGTEVTLTACQQTQAIIVIVQDTGQGIAPDDLAQLFDYFFRVEGHRPLSSGLGLGLGMTRKMIEIHHGRITIASTLGAGTTCTITLPTA